MSQEGIYRKKFLFKIKPTLLVNRLEKFTSDIVNSEKETDITVLDEDSLLKAYVRSLIDKIIVLRFGKIEIVEIRMH